MGVGRKQKMNDFKGRGAAGYWTRVPEGKKGKNWKTVGWRTLERSVSLDDIYVEEDARDMGKTLKERIKQGGWILNEERKSPCT